MAPMMMLVVTMPVRGTEWLICSQWQLADNTDLQSAGQSKTNLDVNMIHIFMFDLAFCLFCPVDRMTKSI